ncbi:MAG: ABC transporter ATPase [Flavobacteriaceae bacterium]
MKIRFEELPDQSRIWIYQSNRPFSEEEMERLVPSLDHFVAKWSAHGIPLKAAYALPYRRFIVLGVDQDTQKVSGCSIDDSVRFIQELEKEFDVTLLDKMNVTYKQGEYLAYKSLSEFRKMVKDKAVSANTIVFNNLVDNKGEFETHWEVSAGDSWHSRFL